MDALTALTDAGEALYGTRWRKPLARSLQRPAADYVGVDLMLLRHWLNGVRPMPAWVLPATATLLRAEAKERSRTLKGMAERIEALVSEAA